MANDRVVYNAMEMAADWPERITAAQQMAAYLIGGAEYPRVRYGDENGGPFPEPCHDCAVLRGQYHVEFVCDMEQCPSCGGQVIACDCPYDTDGSEESAEPLLDQPPMPAAASFADLLARIRPEIEGCSLFYELRDGRFVAAAPDSLPTSATALVVTSLRKGIRAWESEEPAFELSRRLRERCGLSPLVLISRDPDSFVGYFVRITP